MRIGKIKVFLHRAAESAIPDAVRCVTQGEGAAIVEMFRIWCIGAGSLIQGEICDPIHHILRGQHCADYFAIQHILPNSRRELTWAWVSEAQRGCSRSTRIPCCNG